MAKLTWDSLGDRTYNYGVSKVVLYNLDGSLAAKWDGVTSIKETSSGAAFEETFFDGRKFYHYPSIGTYEADVSAVSFPKELLGPLGVKETRPGFFLTNQEKSGFHMIYQTRTSYDGYKIHMVSNIRSSRASSENKTIDSSVQPEIFTWKFTATPTYDANNSDMPPSKIVVDSKKIDPYTLQQLENIFYGTEFDEPIFPV